MTAAAGPAEPGPADPARADEFPNIRRASSNVPGPGRTKPSTAEAAVVAAAARGKSFGGNFRLDLVKAPGPGRANAPLSAAGAGAWAAASV